jgi:predicted nucleotidyltransferase
MKSWELSPPVQTLVHEIVRMAKPSKVLLFGSRARGDFRENSDVDLCVVGKQCDQNLWNRLLVSVQEDPHTLLKVDLVEFEKLSKIHQDEINKDGVILYESDT